MKTTLLEKFILLIGGLILAPFIIFIWAVALVVLGAALLVAIVLFIRSAATGIPIRTRIKRRLGKSNLS